MGGQNENNKKKESIKERENKRKKENERMRENERECMCVGSKVKERKCV